MNISNLSAVFCPGILRHPDHNTPVQYKISQYVIEFLIEFQSLFTMQLLVPTKRKKSSTASSGSGGEVPPVPLLLPSSYPKQPPPVPLHVVNPSAPSELSLLSTKENPPSTLIESPLEVNAQYPQQRSINGLGSVPTSQDTASTAVNTKQQPFMRRATKAATPYYHFMLQKLSEFKRMIEPWIGKNSIFFLNVCAPCATCKY